MGLTARRLFASQKEGEKCKLAERRHPIERKGEAMSKEKETTALSPSVGADGGQPSKTYTSIITEKEEEFNENFSHSQDFFRKPQWDRGQNTQADGQPTVMLLKPCRASSRREEFGLLGRQSDWKKAAPGKRTGEIISLSSSV